MREVLAMSVPSGLVRSKINNTGHRQPLILKALRESVRLVRSNFYSLTYARVRVEILLNSKSLCINSLIYSFLTGQAGQKKEMVEIVKQILVRSLISYTGQAGQTGQVEEGGR